MKYIARPVFLISALLFISCGTPSDGLLDPGTDSLNDSHTRGVRDAEICHGNMEALSDGVCQFYGKYNQYPGSLDDLAAINPRLCSLTCPTCSLQYEYETDINDNFLIRCPLPEDPDHGFIDNGLPSWPPDPSNWQQACQNYMMHTASACAMYYGKYNEYPEDLQDLVDEGYLPVVYQCPACNIPLHYTRDTLEASYTIHCPLPSDPTHGYIIDGIAFFPPDTTGSEEACRSNMICLATAMAMYYGKYNEYPEELEDLGTSGIYEYWYTPCPACGRMYNYWTDAEGQTYAIYCPLPWDPGHGSVYDGMISWE